ncbi:hypothetical protein K402DRAFT_404054 [Aulographum hederae CBS 113979]|uniref:TeaA receptor TeaR n=1 Tax=Aulographum hederae CBS 113979 TaxID=1176131 RepID=A0A6G1H0J3_9PEZI|nr:hypothetical protein K402DRAFT_404054 [Aulographum hederae CBS 113979]
MAAVSPTQPIRTLTPPSSSHGNGTSWDFAVPLDNENSMATESKPATSFDTAPKTSFSSNRQPLAQQTNGSAKPPYQRVDSNPASRKVSAEKRKAPPKNNAKDVDESNWIHRDKLAQIESRELEEAGFRVEHVTSRSSSRSTSRSRNRRDRSSEQFGEQEERNSHAGQDKRQRRISPILAEDEIEDVDEEDPLQTWDLRTPEEIAADVQNPMSRQQQLRPSTSRIPIARTSPMPVPQTFVERDAPTPRSRHGSGSWGEDIASQGQRVRSGSIGSQILLDDFDSSDVPSSPARDATNERSGTQYSPQKAKSPVKAGPTSGARKGNRTASQTKTRKPSISSSDSPNQRPGTSSGRSRPSTSHNRPLGEPPWIASMYKPDPRLPPDQQMLPTHAKRMAQEQWEKEGKTGSAYDRDFRLLNTDDFGGLRPERRGSVDPPTPVEEKSDENLKTWPLASPKPEPLSPTLSRPDTGGTEHGGYKTMPTIQSPKQPPTSPRSPHMSQHPVPTETIRMQEPHEEAKPKKGCCCIVM